jgi:hypothetical protein
LAGLLRRAVVSLLALTSVEFAIATTESAVRGWVGCIAGLAGHKLLA